MKPAAGASVVVGTWEWLPPSQGRPEATTPFRVLIVDDDENVRTHVNRMLKAAGYDTAVAADGPKALEVATGLEGLDLLLTDFVMPHMNGDELASRLRANHRQLKVLYLTGFRERLFAYRPALWENESVLDKPCSMNELLAAVAFAMSPLQRPDCDHMRQTLAKET